MKFTKAFLILKLSLFAILLAAFYNNCSRPQEFSQVQENTSGTGSGTVAGNPMTSKLLKALCSTLSRCHTEITDEQCTAGVLQTAGIGPRFGLPATLSGPFSAILDAEANGEITNHEASLNSCVAEIESLNCSAPEVQAAYDSSAAQPFTNLPAMIPTTVNSCPSSLVAEKQVWTWVAGNSDINKKGLYGIKGVPSSTNLPGARVDSATVETTSGSVYLFGGIGYDSTGDPSQGFYLNDLWKWDGANWTWLSGSQLSSAAAVYGTKGVAADANRPGSRQLSVLFSGANGDLWLFGGYGHTTQLNLTELSDLWRFDGSRWTWISGVNTGDTAGVYGQKGVASPTNRPGGREGHAGWIDASGVLWIFGGYGYGSVAGQRGYLNDLWKYDPQTNEWTWTSGSDMVDSLGSYGTKGVAVSTNLPRARSNLRGWRDAAGNAWIFAGQTSANGVDTGMNDLWKWDGANWTWISGSATPAAIGVYGVQKQATDNNVPGARSSQTTWSDSTGNIWLFGGYGYDSSGNLGNLNDLWKFDGKNWTWISGSNLINQSSNYGTLGVPAATNSPGSRERPATWMDSSGRLWLFGGVNRSPSRNYYNDLWRFEP